jgi:hypothetical protein
VADEPKKLETPETTAPVTDQELIIAFGGPAFHTNKIYASLLPMGVRVAFMEQLGDKVPATFRTAVFLNLQDAFALRDLLSKVLENVKLETGVVPKAGDGD